MGAWGTGPFDNDDAGDWVSELRDAHDLAVVRQALAAAVANDDYLEAPEGNVAVAAAAVVAASLDGAREGLPEDVQAWLRDGREWATVRDARLARRALDRVTGANSEAAELWADSSSAEEWSQAVASLRQRLADSAK